MSQPTDKSTNAFNLTLLTVVGQVGCITPIILIGALLLGLWLDQVLGTRPLLTVVFIVLSAPVAVITLLFIWRKATNRIKDVSVNTAKSSEEELNRE